MIRKGLLILLTIILVIFSGCVVLGADNQLSFEDALWLALENNGTLQTSDLDVEKAEVDLDVAYRNLLPQISLQSTYTRLDEGVPTPTGEYMPIPTGQSIPMVIPIPGMGDVPVEFPIVGTLPVTEEGSANMFNTQITLQQPLFVGGKALLGISMAKKGVDLAQIQNEQAAADILYGVIQSYYNLVLAEEMLAIQRNSLKLLEEHERIARVNYEAGLVLKSDLLQIEIEKRKAVQGLKSGENGVYLAKRQLADLLGLDGINYEILRPEAKPELKSRENQDWLYSAALNSRTELQALEISQQMLEDNLKMSKRYYWPNIVLMGNYSWQGSELNFEDGSWNISLAATMQVFDGGISNKEQSGIELQIDKLKLSQESLSQMVELELEEALLKMEEAKDGIALQELSRENAQENLRLTNERYKAGVGTNLDVLNAQSLWENTELSYFQGSVQYELSLYKVMYKAGILVDYCKEVMESEK